MPESNSDWQEAGKSIQFFLKPIFADVFDFYSFSFCGGFNLVSFCFRLFLKVHTFLVATKLDASIQLDKKPLPT